jgi:hypothetical protein
MPATHAEPEFPLSEDDEMLTPEEERELDLILHGGPGVRATAHSDGTVAFYLPNGRTETI